MSDQARKLAREHGLPDELEAGEVAQALEDAASEIRKAESHEGWLLDAIDAQAAAKRDDEVIRHLLGGGEDDG